MTWIQPGNSVELTAGDPKAKGLRVVLEWVDDRFVHSLYVMNDGAASPLLRSDHTSDDSPWPKSIPMQQVSIEQVNGKSVLLAVGQAGTSHWSVSIEVSDTDGPAIKFDCACRCTTKPQFLGSRYVWQTPVQCNIDAFAGILFHSSDATVQFSPDDGKTVATSSTEGRWLEVRPESSQTELPATIQWSYRICLM